MTGLLLCNLGTPEAPTEGAVRRYLREFLSDPRVIDINPVGRWLLLNLIILPRRPKKSAEAYQKIWTPQGSPLLIHGRGLADAVRTRLGGGWAVALGMRYGRPSLASALAELRQAGATQVVVLPLYPQEADSTTGSTVAEVRRVAGRLGLGDGLSFIEGFHDHPGFLDAFAEVGRPLLASAKPAHVLMSFHGLPERHLRKADPTGRHCLTKVDCCDRIGEANRHCYRAQSYATARALAARLALPDGTWSVSFQSRLGRAQWIRPYTDATIAELAARGKKRLLVICPAFVADCLETLEEIGLRAREQFRAAGGDELTLVPSLNTSPVWCDAVVQIVRDAVGKLH
jgi:ferrochelatase